MSVSLVSRACPTFFRAWCRDAARPGSTGYVWVGRNLAGHLIGLSPNDADDEDWRDEMERLSTILESGDDAAALRWFDEHLPRCMKLIPAARRAAFLQGFRLAVTEDEIDITAD